MSLAWSHAATRPMLSKRGTVSMGKSFMWSRTRVCASSSDIMSAMRCSPYAVRDRFSRSGSAQCCETPSSALRKPRPPRPFDKAQAPPGQSGSRPTRINSRVDIIALGEYLYTRALCNPATSRPSRPLPFCTRLTISYTASHPLCMMSHPCPGGLFPAQPHLTLKALRFGLSKERK